MSPGATYGSHVPAPDGGVIAGVDADSPAARAGIVPGDVIASVDDEPLRDLIDWRWHTDVASVTLAVRTAAGGPGEEAVARRVELAREAGEPWGLEFTELVFDGVRTCRNRCAFCFMAQLPAGLRRALYLRDDDYRLSFLQGNFVTLTNLTDSDVDRIIAQHLSPLYVSLHAVSPDVRERLVCARGGDRALEFFDALVEGGIETHIQIVAVPGVNDAEELDATLRWLAAREGVLSVGVVPLGYTAHQTAFERSYEQPAEARTLLDRIAPWAKAFAVRDGVRWVYAADELYLNAGVPVPVAGECDGFPQYENGIGLVRAFLDEWDEAAPALFEPRSSDEGRPLRTSVAVLTGMLFAPVLQRAIASAGLDETVRVVPVVNRFFGGNVTVSGLLTAQDITSAVRADAGDGPYFVPDVVFNSDGLTLDDATLADIVSYTSADVRLVSSDAAGLASALAEAHTGGSH